MVTPTVRLFLVALLSSAALPNYAETLLLDFSSPTCGPCQQMRPVVHRLIQDGLPVREIDITREPQLAQRYGVTQVPTFLVIVDGQPTQRLVGATTYEQLHRMLRQAMPAAPARPRVQPLGQSPSTFADTPATVAPAADVAVPYTSPEQNLYEPQPNRVVSIQDPSMRPARHQSPGNHAAANPFPSAPPRPVVDGAGSPNPLHQRLLSATVKLSVQDPDGQSSGTGTIVDARSGEALVLTCGHIFRSSAGKGTITVTTFVVNSNVAIPAGTYQGQLIDFDLDRDLALVSIRPTSQVAAAPIANPRVTQIATGNAVTSVGCNHGQNPTAIDSQVSSIDRYVGHSNIEVAGAPVEGRSGGGLFNARGELIGVCNAADPESNEGLYAALPSIQAKLDSLRLSMIYDSSLAETTQPATSQGPTPSAPLANVGPVAVRGQEPEAPAFGTDSVAPHRSSALSAAEQAALAEIQQRSLRSEVICIIRPQDPDAKSEVITLHNVSAAFVESLTGTGAKNPPTPTTAATATEQLLR